MEQGFMTKPNVILILAHDMGFSDIGWWSPAYQDIHGSSLSRRSRL
jgi:arylsulfatase A-like enzyme